MALPFEDTERASAPALQAVMATAGADRTQSVTILSFPAGSTELKSDAAEPARRDGRYAYAKYGLDLVAASILFILALPVFALIALAIAVTSPGGVFFRQTRVGKDMQPFQCLKFRTMVPNAEAILMQDPELSRIHALNWKLDNDPRVTAIGKFLRKTSLDELPQLVNVINGEMSLIGPRPVQFKEVDEQYRHHAATVFSVRPGVTGLWQVSGRSTTTYDTRVSLDCEYVDGMGPVSDLRILAKTILVVVRGIGAH
ncbi:MAG: sugar transferase [Thermomicrobiales bacterium]|jgi:exopolysaccharide production protein ExoY